MGNPKFFYYPVSGGLLQTIDLGTERLSDMVVTRIRSASDAVSRSGKSHRDSGGCLIQVQIVMERFASVALVRQFRNLSTHLERGGSVGFALDVDKLWAGFSSGHSTPGLLYQGHQLVTVPGSNSWSSWNAGSLADDDPIVIQSAPPESVIEHHSMNGTLGATATVVNFDNQLENDYHQTPFLVRHRDFYPALKMPQSRVEALSEQPIVESHRRLNYTLDLTLVEAWGQLRGYQSIGAVAQPGITRQSKIKTGITDLYSPYHSPPSHSDIWAGN